MNRPSHLIVLVVAALSLVGCPGDDSPTTPSPTSTGPTVEPPEPDPLVPYSPSQTPLKETTSGFLGETLTLPTSDGQKLHITFDRTAIKTEYVDGYRSLSVWVTLRNPGDRSWTGVTAASARITDLAGGTWDAVDPTPEDLHPNPEEYEASNFDLRQEVTLEPGQSLQGVIVFRPTGGNRSMKLAVSFDGGTTWGEWQMNLGPF